MRIALLSDIHGNAIALNAVLADIAGQGRADAWDLSRYGRSIFYPPYPMPTLFAVTPIEYVCTGDRPSPSIAEAKRDPQLLGALVEVANTFAWTQGMVAAGGWLHWLPSAP